ncbi:MAG: CPBP family intramembrane metalloprotease [Candidatus Limnocylindrales bacterium]|nr:CPBP family intramembrane metalloprotease [Candidatus Limnocylindrales bacterium]
MHSPDAQARFVRPAHSPDATIAAPGLARRSGLARPGPAIRAALITLALAGAIGARWAATVGGISDGIAVGAVFGALLLMGAAVTGWHPRFLPASSLGRDARAVAIGLAGGTALVVLALATRWPGPWLPFQPAASFLPWAAVTVLVATAEEVVLRGVLFDVLDEASGTVVALAATSVAFALLHVPLYGWHVVPLDLGVGLFLGGLRVLTGGVAAPAVAHAVADLATWWI